MFYLSSDKYMFITKGESGSLHMPVYVYGIEYLPAGEQTFRFKVMDPITQEVVLTKDFKEFLDLTAEDTKELGRGFYVYYLSVVDKGAETFVLENLPFVVN